jgi:transposase-like protein
MSSLSQTCLEATMRTRKRYNCDSRSKVAPAAIKRARTTSEIAAELGIHPDQGLYQEKRHQESSFSFLRVKVILNRTEQARRKNISTVDRKNSRERFIF